MMILYIFEQTRKENILSLMPTEFGGGISFSNDEIISQSLNYSYLYETLISSLSTQIAEKFDITFTSAKVISRVGVVPLVHFFMDRLIRLDLMIRLNGKVAIAKSEQEYKRIDSIDSFCKDVAHSDDFNQYLLSLLAKIWDLEIVSFPLKAKSALSKTINGEGFNNHLFDDDYKNRFSRKVGYLLRRTSKYTGKIPAITMVNNETILFQKGLYGFGKFSFLDDKIELSICEKDLTIRNKIFNYVVSESKEDIFLFLKSVGFRFDLLNEKIINIFSDYLSSFFPTSLLESIIINIDRIEKRLERYKSKTIVSCGISLSNQSAILVATAKKLKRKVIGSQHGGHHGYIKEHVWALEGEYAFCDEFITWGWRRFERIPGNNSSFNTIRLPPPWLCYRVEFWKRVFRNKVRYPKLKEFDFLLFSNKIYPLPVAPSGAHLSINHIENFASTLLELIKKCRDKEIRIFHKPYNHLTFELIPETHRKMLSLGGTYYKIADRLDKGLTPYLVEKAHVILFDQPGTGFLECLACDIPTMVLWTRLFNTETPWAEEIFKKLEKVGIIHRTIDSLVNEIMAFKISPLDWMENPNRKNVIKKFCNEYVWTPKDWAKYWSNFVKELV
ncbi:hypothetical protein LEP1GSC175_1691 [Leptospira santarosai str. HAI821]|uniref:hypothetical protein n=2 Tax=Leptospira santarosai TaxID=28183 RepID=UPI0002BF3AD7|nr:hypothetical protein [Leptospira santarosai]EMO15262.1 hypothetical protein LEP1GSC165_0761 [Leptospira santarosai str. CBC523]EMO32896.1 hypothetical protein LEP1GSC175_1691 [Leptospira santarosai str. HAI821]